VSDETLQNLETTKTDEEFIEHDIDLGGSKTNSEQLLVTAISDGDVYSKKQTQNG
jgi:hypothetical protein